MTREEAAKQREGNEIEFSRIVAFSDGVFAVAITLLVLKLDIPGGRPHSEIGSLIWDQRENFFAFVLSFAVIARYWLVHHRFFGEVRAFDPRLISLNMLYLGSIVLIPFSSDVLGEYGGQSASVILYAANLSAVVLIGLWMTADAQRAGLTTTDPAAQRESWIRSAYIAAVFLCSIPLALVTPTLAQFLWLVLFFDPASWLASRGRSGGGGASA